MKNTSGGSVGRKQTNVSTHRTITLDILIHRRHQIRSVAQSCPTLCDIMNRSTPGLPVHRQLPEFTETHVHRVSDAIQPSHPLSSPSPAAPIPNSIIVFSNESNLRMRWPKYWSFSFSISPSKGLDLLAAFFLWEYVCRNMIVI